jgi:hypothetical protein
MEPPDDGFDASAGKPYVCRICKTEWIGTPLSERYERDLFEAMHGHPQFDTTTLKVFCPRCYRDYCQHILAGGTERVRRMLNENNKDNVVDFRRARAKKRMSRMMSDLDLISARQKTNRPVPMMTAPWLPADMIQKGFYYPHEAPVMVHLSTHFETFPSVVAMLYRWVVNRELVEESEKGDEQVE